VKGENERTSSVEKVEPGGAVGSGIKVEKYPKGGGGSRMRVRLLYRDHKNEAKNNQRLTAFGDGPAEMAQAVQRKPEMSNDKRMSKKWSDAANPPQQAM
jgi:hypothetical protein